jgi:deoxyribodipyrimidine photo-lyase
VNMAAIIWWIRRDLRLSDNQALTAALTGGGTLIPLFVLDPALLASEYVGEKRLAFLSDGLRRLDADLRVRGSQLIVRRGRPLAELGQVMAETGATAICAEADYSPYARRRDADVAAQLPLKLFAGLTVYPPQALLKEDGAPYKVFTPFSRRWKSLNQVAAADLLPAPEKITRVPWVQSEPIPQEPVVQSSSFTAGEAEGQRRLQAFCQGLQSPIHRYEVERNLLGRDGTSSLSPYLRFGMISARQAVVAAYQAGQTAPDREAADSVEAWRNELIWREFYHAVLYHFPQVRSQSFRPNLRHIAWQNDESQFDCWCQGRTGYPIVDAAMRQLAEMGWMHNRARMVTASFLAKHLLIDWRWGERWFMQQLIDGEPAANNGGWQWTAGTGTDAAPYFRVFNPILQGERFDAQGAYVRRWVPELAGAPLKYLHAPWKMPQQVQTQAGCVIGRDYPRPIVDHAAARKRALAAFKAVAGEEVG